MEVKVILITFNLDCVRWKSYYTRLNFFHHALTNIKKLRKIINKGAPEMIPDAINIPLFLPSHKKYSRSNYNGSNNDANQNVNKVAHRLCGCHCG